MEPSIRNHSACDVVTIRRLLIVTWIEREESALTAGRHLMPFWRTDEAASNNCKRMFKEMLNSAEWCLEVEWK